MNNTPNIIPVITLYQPWASFVMLGWKEIETRIHNRFKSLNGKVIGIHAGKNYDKSDQCLQYLTKEQRQIVSNEKFATGVLLGTARVVEFDKLNRSHSGRALIDCATTDRWGLFLTDIKIIEPIPVQGDMGIWYFDLEAKSKVRKPNPLKNDSKDKKAQCSLPF